MPVLLLAAGLALLAVGGECLVRGSARLAAAFGVSPLVIGLTVVAFGTSAPELAVSLQAVRSGTADLAVGNVVGSNIFNVLFILGASAAIAPLIVSRRVVRIEVPIMIAVSGLAWLLAADGRVDRLEGMLLLGVIAGYTLWLLRTSRGEPGETDATTIPAGGALRAAATAGAGLALLVVGARWLVEGAVAMALALGVSDVIIGLTVVAAGTSLPEVAASMVAAVRGHRDMAVGNVLGSNIFNLTVILGTTTLGAGTLSIAPGVLGFDLVVMVAVAVACLPIFVTGQAVARWEGGLFLAYYGAYVAYLVLDATQHETLPRFRDAMVLFALPITALTLVVLAVHHEWRAPRR